MKAASHFEILLVMREGVLRRIFLFAFDRVDAFPAKVRRYVRATCSRVCLYLPQPNDIKVTIPRGRQTLRLPLCIPWLRHPGARRLVHITKLSRSPPLRHSPPLKSIEPVYQCSRRRKDHGTTAT